MALFLKNQGQKRKLVKDDIVGPTQKRPRLSSSDNDVDETMTEEDNISPSSEEPLLTFSTPDSQHALNDRDEIMSSFKDHVQVNESSTQPFQTPFNDNSEKDCQNTVDMDICKTKDKEKHLVNVPSFEERSLIEGKETVTKKTTTDDISSKSAHSTDDDDTDKDIPTFSKSQSILNNESIEDQSSHETNELLLDPSFRHVFHDHCYSRPYHSTSDSIISQSTMGHNTNISTSVNDVESQDLFSEARETTRVSPLHDALSKETVYPSRKLDKNTLLCEKHLVDNSGNRADNININTGLTTNSPDIETIVTNTVAMEICQSDATDSDLSKQTTNHYVAANLVNSEDLIANNVNGSSDDNVPTETSADYYQTKITPVTVSDDTPVNKDTCIEITHTTSKTTKIETKDHISEDELISPSLQKEANRLTMSGADTELSLPSLNKEPLSLSKLTENLSTLNVSLSLVMKSADPVELEQLAKVCSQFVHLYLEHR